jgi:type I restriction enzyme S subunit
MHKNWKTYKLGEVADVQNGYAFKSKDLVESGIPVIKIKNIVPPNISLEGAGYFDGEIDEKLKKYIIKRGDFLISMTGSTVNVMSSAVGKMGKYRLDDLALLNQRAGKIYVTNPKELDFEYLCHFLSRYEIHYNLALNATGSANQANISPAQIKDINLFLPPLKEQTQIANILSAIDNKIENNLATNKTLEDMAMALYKHWFVDFGPFQDGEFVDSELGLIPKGWEVKKFNLLIDKIIDNRGKTPPLSKEKTNFLLLETYQLSRDSLFPNEIQENKAKYVSEEIYNNLKWFRKGHPQFMDILFATVGNGIPNWSIMYENDGVGIAQNVVAIRPKTNISSSFLRYSFESQFFLEQFDGYVITTAQPSIKLSDLNMIDMILPKQEIIDKWNRIVNEYVDQVYINYKENKSLTKFRDTLLPKLISGEVRLKEFR